MGEIWGEVGVARGRERSGGANERGGEWEIMNDCRLFDRERREPAARQDTASTPFLSLNCGVRPPLNLPPGQDIVSAEMAPLSTSNQSSVPNTMYSSSTSYSSSDRPSTSSASDLEQQSSRVKCVLVGDAAVGKTSLIVSYTTNGYPQEYLPTAFDNYSVVVRVDNQPVRLQLGDTAGQDDFDSLRPLCYPQTDVFLLCFSVVSPASFYNLAKHWEPELRAHAPDAPVVLVGTQSDLRHNVRVLLDLDRYGETPVGETEARDYAQEIGAVDYVECSALTQQNLKEVFDCALLAALDKEQARVFLQEVKGGKLARLKEKLRRTNSCSEDAAHQVHQSPAISRKFNVQASNAFVNNGCQEACGFPLTHTQSAVMLKRQLSNPRLNELRPASGLPPKFAKVKKGWKRLLCLL